MRLEWISVLLVSAGCAQHCEWTPFVEASSWAMADAAITGGGRDIAFDGATALAFSDGVARLRFEIVSGDSDASAVDVHVWSLPSGVGVHEMEASVILADGARVETLGSVKFDEYAETSKQNPNDAYTSGGAVTAVQVAGRMDVAGESDGVQVELTIAFAIEEGLRKECFDCPGFEGCNY